MTVDEWVSAVSETSPVTLGAAAAAVGLLAGTRQGRNMLRSGARTMARAMLRTQDVVWNAMNRARQGWSQLMSEARAAAPLVDLTVEPRGTQAAGAGDSL